MELRQVVLAKQLFTEATNFQRRQSALHSGLAVSLAQDAVEMFLRAVYKQRCGTGQEPKDFTGVIDRIDQAAGAQEELRVPFRARLTDLNKARVNFKHYGLYPDRTDARQLLEYASDFFGAATQRFFGQDFEGISLGDLVQASDIRERLHAATEAARRGESDEALGLAAEAVDLSVLALLDVLPNSARYSFLPDIVQHDRKTEQAWRDLPKHIDRNITALRRMAVTVSLPIDLAALQRFNEFVPGLQRVLSGTYYRSKRNSEAPSPDDVDFCIRFATDFALAVEARLGGY
ncbi:hypothetical protein [Cupriavidus sp. H39]|uniref:hypothetical protein n=1 Tax=Cupriavidus sp. H39 TaxID=3401635 RepID=UPI003D079550